MSDCLSKTDQERVARDGFTVRPARIAEAEELALLMSEVISWSRLSELGQGFMTLLHRHMIGSVHAICYVAERDGEILGYAVWSADTGKFYREFLLRHGIAAAVKLAPKIFRPRQIEIITRGLTYFHEAHPEDPQAEVLSFAVRPHAKRSGVGKAIFNALAREFKARGIDAVKVGAVEATNEAGNKFYSRVGCELIRTEPFYREGKVNVYVYRIT
jgi:ribosomal protein S18 acetylase RimI-like enzyme